MRSSRILLICLLRIEVCFAVSAEHGAAGSAAEDREYLRRPYGTCFLFGGSLMRRMIAASTANAVQTPDGSATSLPSHAILPPATQRARASTGSLHRRGEALFVLLA